MAIKNQVNASEWGIASCVAICVNFGLSYLKFTNILFIFP